VSREPEFITDEGDERLEPYADVRDKDLRGHDNLFMAESEMVVRRLLRTPERLHSVLLSPTRYEAMRDALADLPERVALYVADLELMTSIAGFHIHRGVLAAGIRPAWHDLTLDAALGHLRDVNRSRLLIAEGITNVDNVGALFRNAAAFGMDGVVLDPTCCDPLYRKAIRVSMGHVLSLPWAVCQEWPGDLERLRKEWGVTVVGLEVTDDAKPIWEVAPGRSAGLLVGSEGHGLSAEALAACDGVYQIPMAGDVPSLNVAVASAVACYEMMRGDR